MNLSDLACLVLSRLFSLGGVPYVVGGAVRDHLMGRPYSDVDIEVFGLEPSVVAAGLNSVGDVNDVGRSFGVFKVRLGDEVLDVSLPRRDSKFGAGHRGISAESDPGMSLREASLRRDFSMNAIAWSPGLGYIDFNGGIQDIENKLIRAVSPEHFNEDPLRALRALRFSSQLGFSITDETFGLCSESRVEELPAERVWGEMEKILLSPCPGEALRNLCRIGKHRDILPQLAGLALTDQDSEWHPEGDCLTHTVMAVDKAAGLLDGLTVPKKLVVMLATLCHDFGKPATTKFEDGRIRSRGHEAAGVEPTLELLDSWKVHTIDGYDVRGQVVAIVENHLRPMEFALTRDKLGDVAFRRLALKCDLDLLERVARADCTGRGGDPDTSGLDWFRQKFESMELSDGNTVERLVLGRHLIDLGVAPGKGMGKLLDSLYQMQLDGVFSDLDGGLAEARKLICVE